ncbi:MAG: type I glyceraldehyde-3-phosphate dehydrogenase [Nevskiaceae bacterium]|nr:MAG: type I glyceraldehyde-3-phosphate dehydrogenase [Nevskiaceae bacterium]TBR73172.1 MAG: type I glyceraldehyde-3-phosphate dehydrogenase [Nevskiaceae bacterium]
MVTKIAINGYGRIGRNVLRACYEGGYEGLKVVAVNMRGSLLENVHLTRHDTVHGHFRGTVEVDGSDMIVNGDRIRTFMENDPAKLPWKELGVDVVLECTGAFRTRESAGKHLQAGAKKVLVSAPAGSDVKTIVYGVNHDILTAADDIVSNASCTTNCLAPMAMVLSNSVGIESGVMLTIHSYTNDQVLTDVHHKDLRRARAATMSQIPTKTGAAKSVGLVLPELAGKLDGYAVRVPTINVSLVELTFVAKRETGVDEIHSIMRAAAASDALKGILEVCDEPLVSIDFNHSTASCTYDTGLTKQVGRQVSVAGWYDNEWGFSCRMLDTMKAMVAAR